MLGDELAPKYYNFAKEMAKEKIDSSDQAKLVDLSKKMSFSGEETGQLLKRQKLADQVAAWEEFTGNGMTLDTTSSKKAYGPVEVIMLDRKPMKLGELRKQNAIKSLDC